MATASIPKPAPWIEIFRAGDYRSQGKGVITRSDLERVVRNYDPSFHEAPVTVGHPQDNLPAYGWVDRLAVSGDVLLAKEKQVDPQFDERRLHWQALSTATTSSRSAHYTPHGTTSETSASSSQGSTGWNAPEFHPRM